MSIVLDGTSGLTSPAAVLTTTPLAVTSGGTGVTTSTGSGANVLGTSPTLVTPALGAATATSLTVSGNVLITSAAGLGYGAGAGGTVTQATSKSTGVTLNKPSGVITMNGAALAANTNVSFVLTNSLLAYGDIVLVNIFDNASLNSYQACAENSRGGSVYIMLRNASGVALSEPVALTFAIIKSVSA